MNYLALATEKAMAREAIDRMCPGISQEALSQLITNCFVNGNTGYSAFNNGSIYNNNNNNMNTDQNGITKESGLFSSFKAISNLTPEQRRQLDSCAEEISKLQETKLKYAQEHEKREKAKNTNEPTLEQVFKDNNISTSGISGEDLKTTDYEKIQAALTKALEKKKDEQESIKKQAFGEDIPDELENIKLENIDIVEQGNLETLRKDSERLYEKCEDAVKKYNELQEQIKLETNLVSQTTSNNLNERNKQLKAIRDKYQSELERLRKQKVQSEQALVKSRIKLEQYGQKAAKDDKTIGLDGKEIKSSD